MKKIFVKNLSNKFPAKDITEEDILFKLKKICTKKRRRIKIKDNIIFDKKNIPIIAGPNGVDSKSLMQNVVKF